MRRITLPAPPRASFDDAARHRFNDGTPPPEERGSWRHSPASARFAPLDAAFLRRVFGTTLWLGALLTLCLAGVSGSWPLALSFGAGVLLVALLLKSQEWFVRRALRPQTAAPYNGPDRRIPLWLLLPLKYALLAAVIAWLMRQPMFQPLGFAAGCLLVQGVVVARVLGRLMTATRRPLRDVYVKYVKDVSR